MATTPKYGVRVTVNDAESPLGCPAAYHRFYIHEALDVANGFPAGTSAVAFGNPDKSVSLGTSPLLNEKVLVSRWADAVEHIEAAIGADQQIDDEVTLLLKQARLFAYNQSPFGAQRAFSTVTQQHVTNMAAAYAKQFDSFLTVGVVGVPHSEAPAICEAVDKKLDVLTTFANSVASTRTEPLVDPRTLPSPRFFGGEVRDFVEYPHDPAAVNFSLSFNVAPVDHPDYAPLAVISALVGGYNNSPSSALGKVRASEFHMELDEDKSAKSVTSVYDDNGPNGLLSFVVATDRGTADDAMYSLCREFVRLSQGITDYELSRGINLTVQQEAQLWEQDPAAIAKVTTDDIKRVARQYFYDVDPVVVARGQVEITYTNVPDYNRTRSWLSSLLV